MPKTRLTQRIELGEHEGRVGFVMYFTDGTSEVFLFDLVTADKLFRRGLTLIEHLYEAQPPRSTLPMSGVSIGEQARVRLVE